MQSAKETLAEAVNNTDIKFPEGTQIYSNVTAAAYKSVDDIKANLPEQLVSSVHWQQTMERFAASSIEAYIEPGPGQQLKAMLKRVNADEVAKLTNVKVN